MFVYQNGKIYIQLKEQLVGVNIDSDKTVFVKGTETKLGTKFQLLSKVEVMKKFQINNKPYVFPVEVKATPKPKVTPKVKEVVKDGTTGHAKKPTTRSKSK